MIKCNLYHFWCVSFCKAADADTAQVVKVVPTPNNGYTELVKLNKQKVCLYFFVHVNCRLLDRIKFLSIPQYGYSNVSCSRWNYGNPQIYMYSLLFYFKIVIYIIIEF